MPREEGNQGFEVRGGRRRKRGKEYPEREGRRRREGKRCKET